MLILNAEIRKEQGKSASRRLRFINKFPAIVYGGSIAPMKIELDHDIVLHIQAMASFYSDILSLMIDGKKYNVKVQAVQRHPYKLKLTHIDFIRI